MITVSSAYLTLKRCSLSQFPDVYHYDAGGINYYIGDAIPPVTYPLDLENFPAPGGQMVPESTPVPAYIPPFPPQPQPLLFPLYPTDGPVVYPAFEFPLTAEPDERGEASTTTNPAPDSSSGAGSGDRPGPVTAHSPEWVDQRRYRKANGKRAFIGQPPIVFAVKGQQGIFLQDALKEVYKGLAGRDDPMFRASRCTAITLRVEVRATTPSLVLICLGS